MKNTLNTSSSLTSFESFQRLMNVMENDSKIETSKAANRIMRANPEKMPIIMEHTIAFKRLIAASEERRKQERSKADEKRKLNLIETESLEDTKDLSLCLKRNFKEMTFTSRQILEERKRILLEIQEENIKYINISGDLRQIKRILFDYKLGKGYVIAKELEPIFKEVDFAVWNYDKHKYETLYRFCSRYGINLTKKQVCDRSLDELTYGWPIAAGSTLDNYLAITYFASGRRYRSSDILKGEKVVGNIELKHGSYEGRNIETDECIHDFRYLTRRKNVYFQIPYEDEKTCDNRPIYVLKPIKESAKLK